ncbi:MAG: DNA primase, partial [Archaeoglobaceae archaeon]|nr:DNA primase [Archaeoglobaceae archaeon]MDW8128580.1 DNA primase small subunit domain-containing protein [Archaeoglobaceae archaeon]
DFEIEKVEKWLSWRDLKNTAFAVIIGRHSNIYLPEYESIKRNVVVIDEHSGFLDLLDYILQYLPEGVYYDRNVYSDLKFCVEKGCDYRNCWNCENFLGQELAFDIDPENVNCPYHGSVEEKMKRGQGLSFCMIEFKKVRKLTEMLYEELRGEYKEIRIVFSGRGFHIHVLDEKAIKMDKKEREEIARQYLDYAIDEWVTNGEMRLIRLPYSLNGLVSRICTPVAIEELQNFDPRSKSIPSFLL